MKIKRTKNLLYIFSSVMVLGLALISFDAPLSAVSTAKPAPTQNPEHTPTPISGPTQAPGHTATPTPTVTPTPTFTPTPTPTPSLAQLNAAIDIQPATDDIGTGLTTLITDHLTNYYKNEELQVKEINNITCYYKEGLAEADYFVYVSYDISYEGSNVPIPAFDEYLVCIDGEAVLIQTESENPDIMEALKLSRASGSVCELHIKELIRRYMNAKLAADEALLSSLVTDPSYHNMDSIRKKTEYIEEYKNLKYLIFKSPEEITEFEYLVFLASDSKIVNISTLAAGIDEFVIVQDENNYPKIFFGITSEQSDLYRANIRMQETYQEFLKVNVVEPFAEAMLSDPDLLEFIERINNATGTTE